MIDSQNTLVNDHIAKSVTGYMVNAIFDSDAKQEIEVIQEKLVDSFGDSIWLAPIDSLHMTLLDWIAPLVDYGEDKTHLFQEHFAQYDTALQAALRNVRPITLQFDTIKATPGAIIITASNDTEFNEIRHHFLRKTKLLDGTKQPPTIVHSTIARYKKEVPLKPIMHFVDKQNIRFSFTVDRFRLVREDVAPQLQYKLLKEYPLEN